MKGLTGLLKIELPAGDVLLSDAGVTTWNGDTYSPNDAQLGRLAGIEPITEGAGQQIPSLDLTFSPDSFLAVTALSNGAIQQSKVNLWVAEYDLETGAVVGTPNLVFTGFVDQPQVTFAQRELTVSVVAVPELEFLFTRDNGNGLSSTFHKSVYPGELGHDNATGLQINVAWGVKSPPSGNGSSGGSGGGGRGYSPVDYQER